MEPKIERSGSLVQNPRYTANESSFRLEDYYFLDSTTNRVDPEAAKPQHGVDFASKQTMTASIIEEENLVRRESLILKQHLRLNEKFIGSSKPKDDQTLPKSSNRENDGQTPEAQLESDDYSQRQSFSRPRTIMVFDTNLFSHQATEMPLKVVLSYPDNTASQPGSAFGRSRTMLKKIGSLTHSTSNSNSDYRKIRDDRKLPAHTVIHHADGKWNEEEDYLSYTDVSTLEGSIALQNFNETVTSQDSMLLLNTKSSITKENILESEGHLTRGLGRGMGSFREATVSSQLTKIDPVQLINRSTKKSVRYGGLSGGSIEKMEVVPLVEEVVDLSNAEGLSHSPIKFNPTSQVTEDQAAKSYYFPPDPQMPNWRPLTMRSAYIIFLILLALALAGIEEYLCQLSQKLSKGPQGGLLKFINASDVSNLDYFLWKYFPTLVLVLYGVLWQTTDFEVKRLEPYYQLSQPTGATADESLNIDYLTFWSALVPFKALRYKQWAVLVSSCATILAGTLTPVFQSAAVTMYPPPNTRVYGEPKYVRINPLWSRLMEGTLIIVALAGILLLIQLRRKSGLLSDPKGIAGIAAMANRSHILTDFRGLDTAEHSIIYKQLKSRRYILHKSSLWQGEYQKASFEDEHLRTENPQPIMLRPKFGFLYIAFLVVFFILIPIFTFTDANIVTEKLPWILTAIATSVQLMWSTLEGNIRMMEPFYILSQRQAPPKTLTLDYTGTVPIWFPIKALFNRHWIVFIAGIGSILTQVLTVLVSSFDVDGKQFFPGHGIDARTPHPVVIRANARSTPSLPGSDEGPYVTTDQTFNSFWVSLSLALIILTTLSIFSTCIIVFRRRPFLPRQPGTIASVLAFIHQSKMLYDFVDTEEFSAEKMTKHLESLGKTYGLGWYQGRDGDSHCGVDEEVLLASYRHGEDWRRGRVNLRQVGSWDNY